jgi:hypothetical protein
MVQIDGIRFQIINLISYRYTLGQRSAKANENVSGQILISFQPSLAPNAANKRPNQNVIEEIKSRIQESSRNGGKLVDLTACELTRVPQVRQS